MRRGGNHGESCPQAFVAYDGARARQVRVAAKHRAALVLRSVFNEVSEVAPAFCIVLVLESVSFRSGRRVCDTVRYKPGTVVAADALGGIGETL